jgi:hypothetical protein
MAPGERMHDPCRAMSFIGVEAEVRWTLRNVRNSDSQSDGLRDAPAAEVRYAFHNGNRVGQGAISAFPGL